MPTTAELPSNDERLRVNVLRMKDEVVEGSHPLTLEPTEETVPDLSAQEVQEMEEAEGWSRGLPQWWNCDRVYP